MDKTKYTLFYFTNLSREIRIICRECKYIDKKAMNVIYEYDLHIFFQALSRICPFSLG